MTTAIVTVEDGCIVSPGSNYQGFRYDPVANACTPMSNKTRRKWDAVASVFPALVCGRTFMDLGANFGFFNFKALECGATHTIGIEAHEPYHAALAAALEQVPVPGLEWVCARWPTSHQADVVMALSLVHHLAMKTPLERILDDLRAGARRAVLAEWIDPEDKQAARKGLHERPEYTRARWLSLCRERFASVELLGHGHHETRLVYLLGV